MGWRVEAMLNWLDGLQLSLLGLSQRQVSWLLAALAAMLLALLLLHSGDFFGRLGRTIKKAFTTNWQLTLVASSAFILSCASGYTTWDGMRNFTGEPILSGMITFGIQGVMLIIAWLIGESFATGMSETMRDRRPMFNYLIIFGTLCALAAICVGALAWLGAVDLASSLAALDVLGPKFMLGAGVAFLSIGLLAFILNNRSSIATTYVATIRIIAKNLMLWVMFLACMATSVFFSFDSLFSTIFDKDERRRAADIRAVSQVAGVVADAGGLITRRRAEEVEALFASPGWKRYEQTLVKVKITGETAPALLEQLFKQRAEARLNAVTRHEQIKATAASQAAEFERRRVALSAEIADLKAKRPALVAAMQSAASVVAEKRRVLDEAKVAAEAEARGVEGSGKVGKGPEYRKRMDDLVKAQGEHDVALLRLKDAERPVTEIDRRLKAIEPELALIDGEIAKLRAAIEAADEQVRIARDTNKSDQTRFDASTGLELLRRAALQFRQDPKQDALANLQTLCTTLVSAMGEVHDLKAQAKDIDCDPASAAEAAARVFALNAGQLAFSARCAGGDKLPQGVGIDRLLEFAARCLQDSGLVGKDTALLRASLAAIDLNRDDKAHRFVVTWNAFLDGNRLAYLALAIAIAIDSLVFMSGLFGANAIRSPLSDVPSVRPRSAAQLDAVIETALLPDTFENARTALEAMDADTSEPGYMAEVVTGRLDAETRQRVQKVLMAGATINAVKRDPDQPDRYLVRAELFEFLSILSKRAFEEAGASQRETVGDNLRRAELEKMLIVALLPDVGPAAEMVLGHIHPINESDNYSGEIELTQVPPEQQRIVRQVLNAAATARYVRRQHRATTTYEVHTDLYKALARIRARGLLQLGGPLRSPSALPAHDAASREGGILTSAALPDGMAAFAPLPPLKSLPRPALGDDAAPPPPSESATATPATRPARRIDRDLLRSQFEADLLAAIDLTPTDLRRVTNPLVVGNAVAIASGLRHLAELSWLQSWIDEQEADLRERLHDAWQSIQARHQDSMDRAEVLAEVFEDVRSRLPLLTLRTMLKGLIMGLEQAAGTDDGLRASEQSLLDRLRELRIALETMDPNSSTDWERIGDLVGVDGPSDTPPDNVVPIDINKQRR